MNDANVSQNTNTKHLSHGSWGSTEIKFILTMVLAVFALLHQTMALAAPGTPSAISGPSTDDDADFDLTWGTVTGAHRYNFQRRPTGTSNWTAYQYLDPINLHHEPGILADGSYDFRVKACDNQSPNTCSAWTAIHVVVIDSSGGGGGSCSGGLTVPGNFTGPSTDDNGNYTLTWDCSDTATRYNIQRRESGTWTWIMVQNINSLSYQEPSIGDGVYDYRVKACDGNSPCSGWTAVHTVSVDSSGGSGGDGGSPPTPPTPQLKPDPGVSVTSDTIGTIAGSFKVSESGSATYSIPITVASGTGGVAPAFSLNYSSGAGNGIAGIGWSVGGLSAVSRCRQTYDQDRNPRPIDWSAEDRFCLDGQRLVPDQAGQTYGSPNTTYRTEIDSGAIVTIRGSVSGEPEYFEVRRKDGSTSYYGESPDDPSNQNAKYGDGSGKTLTWAIRHFADSVSNPIWYGYDDGGNGHRIKEVRWAFGTGRGPTNGHGARIEFLYDITGDDKTTGYVAGSYMTTQALLTEIKSYNVVGTESLIRQYHLNYNEGINSPDKLNRLTRVEECLGSTCLPETIFDWRAPSSGTANYLIGSLSMESNYSSFTPADINGDGLMDWVWRKGTGSTKQLKYAISTGTGFVNQTFTNGSSVLNISSNSSAPQIRALDYNVDGRQDIAYFDTAALVWKVVLSEPVAGGGWKLDTSPITTSMNFFNAIKADVAFVDVDSNGTTDVIYKGGYQGDEIRVKKLEIDTNQPISSSTRYHFGPEINPYSASTSEMVGAHINVAPDFNGDGQVDMVITGKNYGCDPQDGVWNCGTVDLNQRMILASGFNGSTPSIVSYKNFGPVAYLLDLQTPDVNGDGLSDVFYPNGHNSTSGDSQSYNLEINRGDGTFDTINLVDPSLLKKEANPQFVDWNMDGHPDLAWNDEAGVGLVLARYWNPSTSTLDAAVSISPGSTGSNIESVLFMDVNGDSAPDVVVVNHNGSLGNVKVYTRATAGVPANRATNRIEKITNGLGAAIRISFEPLSYSDHYERLEVSSSTQTATHCEFILGQNEFCFDEDVVVANKSAFYEAINGDWNLPEGAQYLKRSSPVLELAGPMYVVTDVISDAPAAGGSPGSVNNSATSSISYFYKEAKIQAAGRGFLGFEQLKTVDNQSNVETTTRYRQDWPFTGVPIGTTVSTSTMQELSQSTTAWEMLEWNGNTQATANSSGTVSLGSIHIAQVETIDNTYDLNSSGVLLKNVKTELLHDDEANVTWMKVSTGDGMLVDVQTVETTNIFDSANFDLFDARLTSTKVVTTRPALPAPAVTRKSKFEYNLSGAFEGMLSKEKIEPGTEHQLVTAHFYDAYGNRDKSRTTAGGVTRCDVVTAVYDTTGRYVNQTYDCLGRWTTEVVSRNGFGQPEHIEAIIDATDTSARVSTYMYYGLLGREYFRTSQDGSSKSVYLSTSTPMCPAGTAYKASVNVAGGGASETCYDILGRETRGSSLGFDGQWDAQETQYDESGRPVHKSEPFDLITGSQVAPHWTTLTYDLDGRVTYTNLPGQAWVSTAYDRFKTTTTNALNHSKEEYRNVLGEIIQVVDNMNGFVDYEFDHVGNLSSMTHNSNASTTTTTTFNILGQKTAMDDPDMGVWSYEYNHFGELEKQTDAKSQVSTMTYDGLGRMKTRVDKVSNGALTPEASATWNYDSAPFGLGKLDVVSDSQSGYMRAMAYDDLGRVDDITTSFSGAIYYEKTTYDGDGRIYQAFDAAGDGTFADHGVVNQYNTYGHVASIGDAVPATGTSQPRVLYRRINAVNARGQVTDEDIGVDPAGNYAINSKYNYIEETGLLDTLVSKDQDGAFVQDMDYDWDVVGNLDSRDSTHHGQSSNITLNEIFDYDALNRLTTQSQSVSGQSPVVISTTYDLLGLGNIETKDGVQGPYGYGANGAGPHAMTSHGSSVFSYDLNGNNITGDSRTITWTTFNKPSTINKGGHTTSFEYGPARSRFLREDTGSNTRTTHYVGSVEIIQLDESTTERKRYVAGVAIDTTTHVYGTESSRDTLYTLKEHLGSMDVIVDAAGVIVQDLSFGPWGQRRDPDDWKELDLSNILIDLGPTFDVSRTTRGFTGHEMLDDVGVVHMNGRIYDPVLGRFLQADIFIQDPTNTQSLNRYSYVLNNPLNATDPSGQFSFFAAALIGFIANEVAQTLDIPILSAIVNIYTCASGNPMCAAGFAAGSTASSGGNMGDVLKSAALAGLSASAFEKIGGTFTKSEGIFREDGIGHVGAHALTGGVLTELQGGKFGHGFLSAGLTKVANINSRIQGDRAVHMVARVTSAAALGGTISNLTGGKFSNGARNAAYGQLFNGEKARIAKKALQVVENARRRAVQQAWAQEIEMVRVTGRGTREWSKAELGLLKDGIRPSNYQGHHINSVKDFPEMAGDPNNIGFFTRIEHLAEHFGNWRKKTSGALLSRTVSDSLLIGSSILTTLDRFDPTTWAEQAAIAQCNMGDIGACGSLTFFGVDGGGAGEKQQIY